MSIFKYIAQNQEGKRTKGLIEANTENEAALILNEKGFYVTSIQKRVDILDNKYLEFLISLTRKVKPKDIVIFFRQFSIMISANVTVVESLKILVAQTENENFKKIISDIADDINNGLQLSEALGKKPDVFSNFSIKVIRSGESSGKLDEVLNYLADEVEKNYDMMNKIKGAMIYPLFVIAGLFVVGSIMMVFVIPKLTEVLIETGGELPVATKVLIAVSSFLQNFWWLLIIMLGAVAVAFKYFIKTKEGREYFDKIILKLPVFGNLLQRIYLIRFTRSMYTLMVSGVAINSALQIVSEIVSNRVYQDLILKTIKSIEGGNSISSVFIKSKAIPSMVSQMMSVGEKTGKLDLVLLRITDFYEREAKDIIANLMTLMEPIIMVVIGLAVGVMVAAVIMPMYNMSSSM